MSQSVSAPFAAQSAAGAKSLDYIFVIAGWPTAFSVAKSYTPAGDLATFSAIQPWADTPAGAAASVKGRPEEGSLTIGELSVTVLDRVYDGTRSLSDLLSRQAYLEGTSPGVSNALSANLSNSATTVTVTSTMGFPSSGTIHIGLECVKYTGTTSTTFTGCTRGYLLTSATPHRSGDAVYSFMPSVFRRRAFLYKGYQNLGVDLWARAFGGVIAGVDKDAMLVSFSVMSTTWDTYADGKRVLFGPSRSPSDPPIFGSLSLSADVLPGDFSAYASISFGTANLSNGHYLLRVGRHWKAITGVT